MLHRGEKSWEAKRETLSQATAGSHYLPPLDWRDKERWLCHQNTKCGPPGRDWDKPVRKELGPQSISSCCWRHCQRWKGKSSHMLAFPLFLFSNPLPVLPSCPNQARSQLTWSLGIIAASQLLVTHNKQGQSKENNLWATDQDQYMPQTQYVQNWTLHLTHSPTLCPETSSFSSVSYLNNCYQQSPRSKTSISPLIAFSSSFWQSPSWPLSTLPSSPSSLTSVTTPAS